MWLFTQHGFYSVVEDANNASFVFVRAREKSHLLALSRFGIRTDGIRYTPKNDYPYRLRLLKYPTWEGLAMALAQDVNYPNFKDSVHKNPTQTGTPYEKMLLPTWELVRREFEQGEIVDAIVKRPRRRRRNRRLQRLLTW